MFKEYNNKIHALLSNAPLDTNWEQTLKLHQDMIATIQHERLIHLLVTLFVGLMFALSSFTSMFLGKVELLLLVVLLGVLFFAYLLHYRFLENMTQKWYGVREKIRNI